MKKETAVAAIIVVAVLAFVGGYMLGGFDSGVTEGGHGGSASGRYDSNVLPIGESPVDGTATAPVTMVFFADFNTASSQAAAEYIAQVFEDERFAEDVRLAVKVLPSSDDDSRTAAAAALFASENGRFFDGVYEALLENAGNLDRGAIDDILSEAGLDTDAFADALDNDHFDSIIDADVNLARSLGVARAPAVFVNGRDLSGRDLDRSSLREAVFGEQEAAAELASAGVGSDRIYSTRTRDNASPRPVVARRERGGDDERRARVERGDGEGTLNAREIRERVERTERPTPAPRERAAAAPPGDDVERLRVPIGDAPVKGAEDALVTIVEFSDFHCPFCSRVNPTIDSLMEEYGDDLSVSFRQNPLPMHPDAPLAHQAALAAHAQGKFWEMHDLIFANQRARTRADYENHAREIGLDLQAFNAFLDNESGASDIEEDQALAGTVAARGTPHFFINGRRLRGAQPIDAFREVIDSELALARQLMEEEGIARADVYDHLMEGASEEAQAQTARADAPPARVDPPPVGDSPTKGPDDAPVTIYIFSEFQCPYCGRAQPALEQIEEQYGDQVRWVFKSFPLPFHQDANLASQAAYAAGEQGQFWEYHDLLFQNQRALSRADLESYAEQLGLDMNQFRQALDSGRYSEQIDQELAEGRSAGVSGTPTFLINGERLVGAVPFDRFQPIIERALNN